MIEPFTAAVASGIITASVPIAVDNIRPVWKQQVINGLVVLGFVAVSWLIVGGFGLWGLLSTMILMAYGVNQALGHLVDLFTKDKGI